jgi:PKD repeat protein
MKKAIYRLGLWSLLMTVFLACDDEAVVEETVASFQFEAGETEFLTVTFTNFSTNYASSAWAFGDGETSAEESPVHAYAEAGTYEVTLTVTSAGGVEAVRTQSVEVTDPNAKLTLLTGVESKTWKLLRDGTSMLLASDANFTQIYWPGNKNDGTRPCLYNQTFTFNRDGSYVFDDGGAFWGEFGVFNDTDKFEVCFDATAANMVNQDGDDVSAWLSGTHAYSYNATANTVTLAGLGAWIGIPKLATTAEIPVPQSEVTFNAITADGFDTGVDTLFVSFAYEGAFWAITYVSYDDASLEPALVTEFVPEECAPYDAVSPTEISHTFASNDAAEWVLLQFDATSGAGLALGVDDPTDAGATKVGKYTRNAGVAYQELIFELDPLTSVNFENLTTVTMDVYMPSTNTYDPLTDNVFIGFGNRKCVPPNWYEDQHEYQETAIAKDEWVTITFALDAPAFVNRPDNGATVYDRNDMDMIYISIGGGGHEAGGEFFMRNFSIK